MSLPVCSPDRLDHRARFCKHKGVILMGPDNQVRDGAAKVVKLPRLPREAGWPGTQPKRIAILCRAGRAMFTGRPGLRAAYCETMISTRRFF